MRLGGNETRKIVLGVDIGTTNIKCYAYDELANVIGRKEEKLHVLTSLDGRHEIEPESLWGTFIRVVKGCLESSQLTANDVSCMGLSVQRGTFLTWNSNTGESYHNFVTWKDTRTKKLCDDWNDSLGMKFVRFGSYLLYLVTRKEKFQITSTVKFSSSMVLTRLYWIMKNNEMIRQKIKNPETLFGTIDTWLVWKMTGGKVFATDSSNACVTGFFDPFKMHWATWILHTLGIPDHILPTIQNTCDSYGETSCDIFGAAIPIFSVVGDQQASLFGSGCFKKCDINCTMGTGSFLLVNTGSVPSLAFEGAYPLIGWTISSKTTFVLELGLHDVGSVISYAKNIGLLKHAKESNNIAESVPESKGVYFLPGVGLPQSHETRSSAFIGIQEGITSSHMVRAILESLSFQVCKLYDVLCENYTLNEKANIRICGGIASNDFIIQTISDVTKKNIKRMQHVQSSSLGAAFLAGLYAGIWKNEDEISVVLGDADIFSPNNSIDDKVTKLYSNWKKAMTDSLSAYES